MKSPVLTDLVHIIHIRIIQTISGEITSSDRPGTQSYISELYRTYLVKSPVLTDLIHNHTSIIDTFSGEITSSDRSGTHYTYQNYTEHIWWNHQFWPTWYTIIHIRIIQNISGEITSSDWPDTQSYINDDLIHIRIIQNISGEITSFDWPDTQSYINYRDLIWWNHQFWPIWYTLYISELYRTCLVKSPVLTDLIHNHTSIIETISDEITSSDWPDTQSYINYRDHIWWNHQFWLTWYTLYISELYRPYLVKSPVLTDLVHNHTYQNYTEHIWWNHQFWLTWYTIIHQL